MLWAVTDVFFDTLWNVMWRNVWRSYKHIENKEVHTVRTFCTKDPREQREKNVGGALDGSGGQRENDTSWHNIYKYVVKYCPGVVSLWDVGLRDNPARCAVLINKFQYFDFWSLLLFLNTQDNLKSNISNDAALYCMCSLWTTLQMKTINIDIQNNIFFKWSKYGQFWRQGLCPWTDEILTLHTHKVDVFVFSLGISSPTLRFIAASGTICRGLRFISLAFHLIFSLISAKHHPSLPQLVISQWSRGFPPENPLKQVALGQNTQPHIFISF